MAARIVASDQTLVLLVPLVRFAKIYPATGSAFLMCGGVLLVFTGRYLAECRLSGL